MKELPLLWLAGVFLLTFTISLALFGILIVALPERYFVAEHRPFLAGRPPLVRGLGIVGKNLLGLLLIAVGIVLSIPGIPGQGLLTIVIGIVLLDIPGKRRLIRTVVKRPGVLRNLNRVRSWFGRPPLAG